MAEKANILLKRIAVSSTENTQIDFQQITTIWYFRCHQHHFSGPNCTNIIAATGELMTLPQTPPPRHLTPWFFAPKSMHYCFYTLRTELDGYLSQQVCEPRLIKKYSANQLLFWHDNGKNDPLLQQLVALFLGMSASSVPVECFFSITGMICNSRRSSICPSKLNEMSFLHDKLDNIVSICDT